MSGVSDLLVPDMKLEELETSLGTGKDEPRSRMDKAISEAQDSILPMRLQFNDFMQTMSNIDDLQNSTPIEKFSLIRGKVIDLTERLQAMSEDVGKLHPLFDTIPEYSEKYGTKKYQPLETLRFPPSNRAPSPPAPNNTSAGASANKRVSRSNDGTPVSQTSTPVGLSAPSTFPAAAKKPRKPRQTKKVQSTAAAAAAAAVAATGNMKNQASPTPPAHMMNSVPPSNPVQIANGVPPNSMMGSPMQSLMSPLGNTPNYGFSQQPVQQQQQHQRQPTPQQHQQRQQYNPATKPTPVPQSQSMNNITPANILSMSMVGDPAQQQQHHQQNKKEFDPLDFNNLDFGNLNMDMI